MKERKYNFDRPTERNNTLDLLRGLAILIVVIGHAIQVNLSEGRNCFIWSNLILEFQMPLMFLLAAMQRDFLFQVAIQSVLSRRRSLDFLYHT